jgi:Fe-S-cluster-containing dehydrogenase component
MQYAFYFDATRCTQCFTCEVACKAEHGLRPHVHELPGSTGPRYRQVMKVEDPCEPIIGYVSLGCLHCGAPTCLSVCPTGAIYRENKFGAVLVNQKRCIGCRYCSWACKFGAPQFDRDGLMQKCDFCVERLKKGKLPACVDACCSGAILAGPIEEIETKVRSKAAGWIISAASPHLIVRGVH